MRVTRINDNSGGNNEREGLRLSQQGPGGAHMPNNSKLRKIPAFPRISRVHCLIYMKIWKINIQKETKVQKLIKKNVLATILNLKHEDSKSLLHVTLKPFSLL